MHLKLTIIFLSIVFVSCTKINKQAVKISPKVHYSIGDVKINGGPVSINQEIKDGDVVETGSHSYLEAHFGKQSAFRIREESNVTFSITDQIKLEVHKGKVLNLIEKQSIYQVRTPAAVAAIRGTIFFVSVLSDTKTYFCACNGTIDIQDNHQKELTQLSSAHHQPNYCERDGEVINMSEAGMVDHDDLEIFEFMYRMDKAINN